MSRWKLSLPKRGLKVFAFLLVLAILAASPVLTLAENQSGVRTLNDISGHWAYSQIQQGVSSGWLSGYADGSFKPDRMVTPG